MVSIFEFGWAQHKLSSIRWAMEAASRDLQLTPTLTEAQMSSKVKAKLSGDVRVNFKSDYLPLDKMATPEMMSVIQGNSTPYNPNRSSERRCGLSASSAEVSQGQISMRSGATYTCTRVSEVWCTREILGTGSFGRRIY